MTLSTCFAHIQNQLNNVLIQLTINQYSWASLSKTCYVDMFWYVVVIRLEPIMLLKLPIIIMLWSYATKFCLIAMLHKLALCSLYLFTYNYSSLYNLFQYYIGLSLLCSKICPICFLVFLNFCLICSFLCFPNINYADIFCR